MKKLLFVTLLLTTIIVACSKDQKVVKNLDGTWKVTAMTYDGQPEDPEMYANTTYTFEKCKVKKEPCPGTITASDPSKGTYSLPFTYSIFEDGEKITIATNFGGFLSSETGDILENEDERFVFSTKDEDGKATVTTLVKVD